MNDLYIGVDGGGTKSKLIIQDEKGKELGRGLGGPSNIRLSVDTAWESIMDAFSQAMEQAKLSIDDPKLNFHIGCGLAGCEVQSAQTEFLSRAHPFKTITLESDAYAACIGAHNGKDGTVVIIGTGLIGMQIQEGNISRVGGWGFPHSDEGSGAWLGLESTRLTFKWLDGRITGSPFLEAIYNHFECDQQKFVDWATSAFATKFSKLAPLVFEHGANDDPHALQLIRSAADEIQISIDGLDNKLEPGTDLPLCLFGGIAPHILPYLNKYTQDRVIERKKGATEGAILMLRKRMDPGSRP